jgi:replicative DNA helicase
MVVIENLDDIKAGLDIETVLSLIGYEGSNPLNTGNEIKDYCPIHKSDNQRSLSINTITKVGYCHEASCNFKGNLVQLYMRATGVGLPEAVQCLTSTDIKYGPATVTTLPAVTTSTTKCTRKPHQVLDESSPNGEHPYLVEKCIEGCPGLYFGKDNMGNASVVVPLCDASGNLQSIQFINNRGKYFLTDTSHKGNFFTLVGTDSDSVIRYIAEGVATAWTIWMALGRNHTVLSVGSANNLCHVVDALKANSPHIEPIACLDNDAASFAQARKINPAHECSYRIPSFEGLSSVIPGKKPKDFNDIISLCKQPFDIVMEQLMQEKNIDNKTVPATKIISVAEVAPRANKAILSFGNECQEELLGYLLNKPFLSVIEEGFSLESIEPHIFDGRYKIIAEGILEALSQGLSASVTQIAMSMGNCSDDDYKTLKRIESLPTITRNQAEQRLQAINKNRMERQLNAVGPFISQELKKNQPINEIIDVVRNKINDAQSISKTIFPQSHHLYRIVEEIKNPTSPILSTGIMSLDRLLGGGFKRSELGILSGGAGSGKTAFALQVADAVAANGNIAVYISIEIGERKLTERSLKRLSYNPHTVPERNSFDTAVSLYQKFSNNVYLIKGHHGMQISEIRGIIFSIMAQRKGSNLLLVIDPFQRLGTGNEKIDYTNETIKVNTLCSQIKDMAEALGIPILARIFHRTSPQGTLFPSVTVGS